MGKRRRVDQAAVDNAVEIIAVPHEMNESSGH